jgi:hypothetical protein
MRKSQTSALDLEEQELAEHRQKESRRGGLSLVELRDRGWARVREVKGREATFIWGVKDDLAAENLFKIKVGKEEYIFDAEEFRKYLRWA